MSMVRAAHYIALRHFQKGLKHNVWYSIIACAVVAVVFFNLGRSVEYLTTVKQIDGMIAERMQQECEQ